MAVPEAAVVYYAEQQRITQTALILAAELWRRVEWQNLDSSWLRLRNPFVVLLSLSQRQAAAGADPYMRRVLAETGQTSRRAGTVRADAFAGIASDGRQLDTLLYEPVIKVKQAVNEGLDRDEAMRAGALSLDRIVATQVQDAGRAAVGTAIVAHLDIKGWVRMLNPPSCARCAVLAGRLYRWNDGFERHPLCDCRHIPASEDIADDVRTDPDTYFWSLTAEQQDRYFTEAGARAIRDGADLIRVVNMRGVDRAGRRRKSSRLMPEAIYEQAGDDRDEAIRLLRRNGYLFE